MADVNEILESAERTQRIVRDAEELARFTQPAREIGALAREAARMRDVLLSPYLNNATEAARHMESMREMQRNLAEVHEAPTARRAVHNIAKRIREFEASLDAAHEVGVHLVSFGGSTVVHIREVDWEQPNLIFFRGYLQDGSPVELIQHLSQLSFLLTRVRRLEPDKPRAPIGFNLGDAGGGEE